MKRLQGFVLFVLCIMVATGLGTALFRWAQPNTRIALPQLRSSFPTAPLRMERPPGMHPVAFGAFVRACDNTGIHPWRIGQTLGDHPRSVGYHKRDGVATLNGERIEYSAAVDLGTWDLDEARIKRFVEALAQQGFAAFYRSGPKWQGNEHIHAIYALLPMKVQLRRQVRQFLRERRAQGKPHLAWREKLRRQWRMRYRERV
jgi:hypothetical protein